MSATTSRPIHLPTPLTSFIGREREVGEIAELLTGQTRLLTLVGPGGVGKTRLAIEAASIAADAFPDGVWFVDLAPLTDPSLALPTIARTLGLQQRGNDTIEARLAIYLRERQALLVIDNLEQVVTCAPDLAELLAECPDLVILATSREPLAVGGEQEYPVEPLATDLNADGVRLFVERAHARVPSFALTDHNQATVAEICRRLDGLPLAIELAAARVKTLPPADLLARLDQRLPLLTGTRRDAPQRHQTMRDAIAWSYDSLSPDEQRLFRRLSVFVGGFPLELAEPIADTVAGDVLNGIASLLDKNLLVRRETANGETRYAMLETIREYGLEQLQLHNELDSVRAEHAEAVTAYVEQRADRSLPSTYTSISRLAAEATMFALPSAGPLRLAPSLSVCAWRHRISGRGFTAFS